MSRWSPRNVIGWFVRKLGPDARAGAVFVVAAIAMLRASLSNRFLPGWDYHYHLMSAAIAAKQWRGDPYLLSTYWRVSPLDANTLYYTLLFPLEQLGDPLFAARVGTSLIYFLGYPCACAIALRLAKRPIWGALMAFAVLHVWSMTYGGFMPFTTSAPFFVLSIALMDRWLETRTPRIGIACAFTCTLTFLAHAHVYAWMMALLALFTVMRLLRHLVPGIVRVPKGAFLEVWRTSWRAFVVVLPSLILLAVWFYRTQYGHSAPHGAYAPREMSFADKFNHLRDYLTFTRADREYLYLLILPLVCALSWLLSARKRDTSASFEIAFLITAASFLFLPLDSGGQVIGPRHIDMAMWLLPLVIYPARPKSFGRRVAIAAALASFAYVRSSFFTDQLRALQKEFDGLVAIMKDCPPRSTPTPSLVAYMSMGMEGRTFRTPTVHQPHESFAAMCSMETPVYDARVYPHNVIPLRYRGALPAPITILVSDSRWYARPGIWQSYEYVLVHGWTAPPGAQQELDAVATPVRSSGEWTLWKRR